MADPLRHNLFRFAPKELSHSAFWAWMMQSLDAQHLPLLKGPRSAALRLLKAHGVPRLRPPIEVETECKITARNRLDVRVTDANETVVVIENKVKAIPDAEQIKRYRASLGADGQVHLLILSTAFDIDVRCSLGCEYVGVDELRTIIRPYRNSHFLLSQYFEWLEDLHNKRMRLSREAHSSDSGRQGDALGTPVGQWAFMATLTKGMRGRQYRGVGLSGNPWTQFGFVEQTPMQDAIFYRIDASAEGYHLRINQYRNDVHDESDARPKIGRLKQLRTLWSEACRRHGKELRPAEVSDRGVKESVIGRFLLRENPPSRLVKHLAAVHGSFLRKLRHEGWSVV